MSRASHIVGTLAVLALLAAPVRAQTGMIRGTVQDSDGKPIAGVKLTVTSEQNTSYRKTMTTGKKGTFTLRFTNLQAQYQYVLLFEKPGYESFEQGISPSAMGEVRETYVMEEAETKVVERIGDLSSVVTGSTNVAVEAFNAGLTAQRAGDLETARAKLEEAAVADPDLTPAHIALAQVLLDLREYEAAIAAADRALDLAPGRAEALRAKHQALRALGRKEESEAVALTLEQAEDAVAAARRHYNEAGEAFQAGDRDTALAGFQRASELDPSLIDAHHAVATLLLARGEHEAAAEAAQKALSLGSEDVRTLRVLYDAYDALGRHDELTEIAPRLAAVDADFGGAKLVEQAADLWNAGQADGAASLSRQALAIDPGLAKAYYFIGLDHLARGENADAKAALQKFIDLAPDDPEAGTAAEMLGYIE
ncbi:MAG: carboxypeptidase regulatory-like domain-containing protein [Thermoanaerobaculia bacterium]